jgi:hypothetical protein
VRNNSLSEYPSCILMRAAATDIVASECFWRTLRRTIQKRKNLFGQFRSTRIPESPVQSALCGPSQSLVLTWFGFKDKWMVIPCPLVFYCLLNGDRDRGWRTWHCSFSWSDRSLRLHIFEPCTIIIGISVSAEIESEIWQALWVLNRDEPYIAGKSIIAAARPQKIEIFMFWIFRPMLQESNDLEKSVNSLTVRIKRCFPQ